ncbi:MAG: M28 family peptidase [Flavobacteriales bacterium]|nr:M28 family peptidase [Flavobacteriales bacterium]
MKAFFQSLIVYPFLFCITAKGQNSSPVVKVNFAKVDLVNEKIELNYSLTDKENDLCSVWLKYSKDGGSYFDSIPLSQLTGDVGNTVVPYIDRTVYWKYSGITGSIYNIRLRLYASDNKPVDVSDILKLVDQNRILGISSSIEGVRHVSAPTLLNTVRDTIEKLFGSYGFETERQNFTYSTYNGYNLTGRKAGVKDESKTFIIDAHYDGVNGSPAADDNGSGVAGVLEAARVLRNFNFEHSIRFIGFDFEEQGLVGSNYYVQNSIKNYESIAGVLNMEMIGFFSDKNNSQSVPTGFNLLFPDAYQQLQKDTFKGNFIVVCGNTASKNLNKSFVEASGKYVPELNLLSVEVPGNGEIAPDFRRSDHTNFWENNNEALMLTDGSNFRNPNYHKSSDANSTLNYDFMYKVIKAVIATTAEMAKPVSVGYFEYDILNLSSRELHKHSLPITVNIQPNPSEGAFTFNIQALNSVISKMEVFDLNGKIVWSKALFFERGEQSFKFDFSSLQTGNYIVLFTNGNQTLTKTISIQR